MRRLAIIALVGVLAVGAAGAWKLTHRHFARNPRFAPSSDPVLDVMIQMGDLSAESVVYDLGCGDGRVVIAAVTRAGARGVCVEIDPILLAIAETSARAAGVHDRIRFLHEDLRTTDVSDGSVVYLYLSRRLDVELRPRLVRMMRPGTRIISHFHDMGDDWPPLRTRRVKDPDGLVHPIFLWKVPEDKSKLAPGG